MRKTFLCFLLIVDMVLIALTGCNLEPHEHSFNTYWTYDETNHWHEASCGHDIVSGTSAHSWDSGQVTEQPTHIQSGTRTFTCEICNATKTEMIPALTDAHTFSEEWSFDEYNHWHAATCEHTTLESEKSEHIWDDGIVTTTETHTTAGVKTYKCTICDKTKTETIPALTEAHTFSEEWSFDDDNHWYAATCGHTTLKSEQSEHTWDNGTVTSESTHINAGTKVYKCTVCNKIKKETIPAQTNAHTFSENWSSDNTYHWHAATCGHTTLKSEQSWHRWDNGTVTTEATHNQVGIRTYKCTVCSKTKTETIPAMTEAHTFSEEWTSDDTYHWHDATCGHPTLKSKESKHTWNNGTISTAATCTGEGVKIFTCTTCNRTRRESIPATGHIYSTSWSADATKHWHNAVCKHSGLKADENAHTFSTYGTAVSQGNGTYKFRYACSTCGYAKTLSTPKLGDIGPAGGIIFYDKGEYSDGWRFLEAAPNDLRVVDDKPTVDSALPGYKDAPYLFVFGHNRETSNGANLYVNGSTTYNAENCTKSDIGAGANNTRLLVSTMGTTPYAKTSNITKTSRYAAKLCSDLKYNGYEDWFLPSLGELEKMNRMYIQTKRGSFFTSSSYWSSSEYRYDRPNCAYNLDFYHGNTDYRDRGYEDRVRPVRAF